MAYKEPFFFLIVRLRPQPATMKPLASSSNLYQETRTCEDLYQETRSCEDLYQEASQKYCLISLLKYMFYYTGV
jgi:hypothetical protein